jgi:hypothetical protein
VQTPSLRYSFAGHSGGSSTSSFLQNRGFTAGLFGSTGGKGELPAAQTAGARSAAAVQSASG